MVGTVIFPHDKKLINFYFRYQLAAVMPIFRIDVNKMLGKFSGLTQLQMIEAIELLVNALFSKLSIDLLTLLLGDIHC